MGLSRRQTRPRRVMGDGRSLYGASAAELIGSSIDPRISPMVRLELQYLLEVGRVARPAVEVVDALTAALGLTVCTAPFAGVVQEAEAMTWTRDPFDRLIVAQASWRDAQLITQDQTLHAHYPQVVW